MDRATNPYTPGAGTRPVALKGRDENLDVFESLLVRLEGGVAEQFPLVTGLRGVGKTVLLNSFEDIAEDHGWQVYMDEAGPGTALTALIEPWLSQAFAELSPAKAKLKRVTARLGRLNGFTVSVTAAGELSFTLDASARPTQRALATELTTIFMELGKLARDNDTGAVLLLDEVQFLSKEEFAPFVAALHRVTQKALPVAFVGAGLPQLPRLSGEARSYAERLFDFTEIGRLQETDARQAITDPADQRNVEWEEGAVRAMLRNSDGYPFFIQQYAKYAWLEARRSSISAADVEAGEPRALRKLDQGFFRSRIQRTSDRERRYLGAMASLGGDGPYQSGDVARKLGGKTSQWSRVRENLVNKGLIYSNSYGDIDFTVPHFAAFVHRQYAEFVVS